MICLRLSLTYQNKSLVKTSTETYYSTGGKQFQNFIELQLLPLFDNHRIVPFHKQRILSSMISTNLAHAPVKVLTITKEGNDLR